MEWVKITESLLDRILTGANKERCQVILEDARKWMVCICIVDIYIVSSNEFISSIANLYRPYLNSLLLGVCI